MALREELFSKLLDSLIEFSWILGNAILHFLEDRESSNNDIIFSDGNARSSVFLDPETYTFLR